MDKVKIIAVVVVSIFTLLYLFISSQNPEFLIDNTDSHEMQNHDEIYRSIKATINSQSLNLALSDSPQLRQMGLSGTNYLADGEGMLFVFDEPGRHGIWMKDMNYSLDIIWLDSDKKIIHLVDEVSPDTFPQIFYPTAPASYVIELARGAAAKYQINRGDYFEFTI